MGIPPVGIARGREVRPELQRPPGAPWAASVGIRAWPPCLDGPPPSRCFCEADHTVAYQLDTANAIAKLVFPSRSNHEPSSAQRPRDCFAPFATIGKSGLTGRVLRRVPVRRC